MGELIQSLQNGEVGLRSGTYLRAGQRINTFPQTTITSVAFYLHKDGSPTGTASACVRAVSDDSILGTLGTLDVATLTGDFAWTTFNTTPVTILAVQNIRVTIEFSGGSFGNSLRVGNYSGDVCLGESTSYTTAWTDWGTNEDCSIKLYWVTRMSGGNIAVKLTYLSYIDAYGQERYIKGTPIPTPTVFTQAVTDIAPTTATGNGCITSIGDASVTQHGHCWSTSANPTTSDSKTQNGAGSVGVFTSAITGLTTGTLYHTRAYATNSYGTSYGEDIEFTTT